MKWHVIHAKVREDSALENLQAQGSFKGFIGFFEKLQALPDGLSRAMLLVEVLGSVQKLKIQLPQLKK